MGYKLNSKNLAVARLMPRGPKADKRLKYMHAAPKGTTCLTPAYLVRVSLPVGEIQPRFPVIYTQGNIDSLHGRCFEQGGEGLGTFDMGEGSPACARPDYLIPKIDDSIPDPEDQSGTFTCNGETLLKMLKVATEVCKDGEKPVRLRFYGKIDPNEPSSGSAVMRIDTYRQPGDQEFVGVLKGMEYYGANIPGDRPMDAPVKETKPIQITEPLRVSTGRRFRS